MLMDGAVWLNVMCILVSQSAEIHSCSKTFQPEWSLLSFFINRDRADHVSSQCVGIVLLRVNSG